MSRMPNRVARIEDPLGVRPRRSTAIATDRSRNRVLACAILLAAAAGAHAQAIFSTPQPVGVTAGEQVVSVTAQVAGTVGSVEVLTLGAPNLDFTAGIGFTCQGAILAVNGSCWQSIFFTPTAPGLRMGAVILLDAAGNVLGSTFVSGTGSGGLGVFVPGNIVPVAGDGSYKDAVVDGIPALQAELYAPSGVTMDGAGNLYIADTLHNRIRMVCANAESSTIFATGVSCLGAGIISTIAGNGLAAYGGDNGPAAGATLNQPSAVALDGAGNLYIADTGNSVVRKIAAATGIISTVAGNGTAGYGGDGLAATSPSAELHAPQGAGVDFSGNLYIADTANQRIRKVDAVTGILTTVAGDGFTNPNGSGGYNGDGMQAVDTELNGPVSVAFDSLGEMYIADSVNNRVRMVAPSGIVSTFAGTGEPGDSGNDGAAAKAELSAPSGVIVDPANNVYIADSGNAAIRKVSSAAGVISTVASNGAGESFFNGALEQVSLSAPAGLFLDGAGNLYIADSLNMVVWEIQSNFAALDFTGGAAPAPVRQGSLSPPQDQTLENDGNAPLDLTAIAAGANSVLEPPPNACNAGSPFLAVDDDCTIGAVFAPSVSVPPSDPEFGFIKITSAQANSPLEIELVGDAAPVNSTTTTVVSSNNPSGFGQGLTLTATVTTGTSTGNLTGTVSFFDGVTTLAENVPLGTAGTNVTAVFATTALSVGVHSIAAAYNANDEADPGHFSSTSAPLTQTVLEATATSLVSSADPSVPGANVTFTATVTIAGGGGVAPDGAVTFTDGNTTLGVVTLNAGGVAALTTSAPLTARNHEIVARYGGDAAKEIQASSSVQLNQIVQPASTMGLSSAPDPSSYGTPVSFTVTVTPGGTISPTGTVTILDGGNPIGTTSNLTGAPGVAAFTTSSLSAGSHTITAAYPGDANNSPCTSQAITQTVNPAQTTTAVAAVPNPGIAGMPVAISATVTMSAGAATPTGSVTFSDTSNGATATLGTANLGAAGMAAIDPTLAPGKHSIVAAYSGDANDSKSTSPALALTVGLANTSTVVTAAPSTSVVLSQVTFTATVTGASGIPTGTVSFLADGSPMGAAANLDATGTAKFSYAGLAVGSHAITALYSGDADDSPSASLAIAETVQPIPTATSLTASTTAGSIPQTALIATVQNSGGSSTPIPTGTVTFNNGSTAIGSAALDSSGVATLTLNSQPGAYSVVAVYGGDPDHGTSASGAVSVSGTPASFDIAITPDSLTVATGQSGTVTVTLTSISGFNDTIALSCGSVPSLVACQFSASSIALQANGISTAQLTIDTKNPLSDGPSAMKSSAGGPRVSRAGFLLFFNALFGLFLWRFRKRHAAVFGTAPLLLLLSAAILATGCSDMTFYSAAPGTYAIQVAGTGANSGLSEAQSVTLTITK